MSLRGSGLWLSSSPEMGQIGGTQRIGRAMEVKEPDERKFVRRNEKIRLSISTFCLFVEPALLSCCCCFCSVESAAAAAAV